MAYEVPATGYNYGDAGARYGAPGDMGGGSVDQSGGMDRRYPPAENYGRYDDAPSYSNEERYPDRPRRLVAVKSPCLSCVTRIDGLRITI